jgi:hypothetical protein
MGGLFGGSPAPIAAAPETPDTSAADAAKRAAAAEEVRKRQTAGGRASTFLTAGGALGVPGEPSATKTTLG